MQRAYLIPAYQAKRTLATVLEGLRTLDPDAVRLVVDDGSTDGTGDVARTAGVEVLVHERNLGKGMALRHGFAWLRERGFATAVTVDADGQHRPEDAVILARHEANDGALLIGVRDLVRDGAPKANQLSNRFSNWWVSRFAGLPLADTQCGLRRYPLSWTLAAGSTARGYGFEADILVRAARRGIPIVHVPVRVIYPPEDQRISHFRTVLDPTRITLRLVYTALTVRRQVP